MPEKRAVKSYVLRGGRQTVRQHEGLALMLNDYLLPFESSLWDFDALFGKDAKIIVEIGFGMGRSLLQMAQDSPDCYFIGIEVHRAGLGSLAADLHENQVKNVRIVSHDAAEVFQRAIPAQSLAGIQIFFPDPWPKKKHHKRRIVQPAFVECLTQALKPGGFIHLATDWEPYAVAMLKTMQDAPGLRNQNPEGAYVPRPESRPLTKFEMRGQKLGHGVWDLIFCKP